MPQWQLGFGATTGIRNCDDGSKIFLFSFSPPRCSARKISERKEIGVKKERVFFLFFSFLSTSGLHSRWRTGWGVEEDFTGMHYFFPSLPLFPLPLLVSWLCATNDKLLALQSAGRRRRVAFFFSPLLLPSSLLKILERNQLSAIVRSSIFFLQCLDSG